MSASGLTRAATLLPKKRVNWEKFERIWRNWEIWRDKSSIVHRLPDHYKRRYWKTLLEDKTPVHYAAPNERYTWDEKKRIWIENEDNPPQTFYPPEADQGLWGGEGVVKILRHGAPLKRKKILPRLWVPRLLFPDVKQACLYSEILDKYMQLSVTERTMRLIDAAYGIDYYLLKTPDIDLCSRLGRKLKRELSLSLARKDYWPNNPTKRKEIAEKYAEFVIPEEEAEWLGLDLNEACRKQQDLEEEREPIAVKLKIEKEMVAYLNEHKDDEDESKEGFWNRFFTKK